MKKIGIYGGSFNPPGLHHFFIASAVAAFFKQLLIIPCGFREDKISLDLISDIQRSHLISLTFKDLKNVFVNHADLLRGVFTPTCEIQKIYERQGEIWHIIGHDLVEGGAENESEIQRSWHEGEYIWRNLNFAVVVPANCWLAEKDLPPHHQVIPMEALTGRSTRIRELIARGEPFEHLVMPDVAEYIKEHHLYGYKNL